MQHRDSFPGNSKLALSYKLSPKSTRNQPKINQCVWSGGDISSPLTQAVKIWRCCCGDSDALHVVRVEWPRLCSPGISILTLPRIPACILLLHTCSLAKITHSPKYLSLLFIVPWFPCANTPMHTPSLCRSAHQQPQSGFTAWPTHSSPGGPVMSRSSLFGPTWQRGITLKPCMDFLPFLLLRIPLPWRWLTQVH